MNDDETSTFCTEPGILDLNIRTIVPMLRRLDASWRNLRQIDTIPAPIIGIDTAIGRDISVRAIYAIKCFANNWNIVCNHIPLYHQFLPVLNPQTRSMWKQRKIAPIQKRIRKLQYK